MQRLQFNLQTEPLILVAVSSSIKRCDLTVNLLTPKSPLFKRVIYYSRTEIDESDDDEVTE